MSKIALERAIAVAGGQAALARLLGVKQPFVANWLKRGLPAKRVLAIEAATGVSRYDLKPDIYPTEPPDLTRGRRASDSNDAA